MQGPFTNNETNGTGAWLRRILEQVRTGELPVAAAAAELGKLPYEEMGYATVDHHRSLRLGFPEVIFGQGKTPEQIIAIAGRLLASAERLLITRLDEAVAALITGAIPDAVYNPAARTVIVDRAASRSPLPGVTVVTGGTADIPVAEEAAATAAIMGNEVKKYFDIGVAGLHRTLDRLPQLRESNVIIVVAGMDGALAGVIGGLVAVPIIAVPTSVGYGAGFDGLAPLLTMLNSCAPGVTVVNIDNGFGAGYMAGLINHRLAGQDRHAE
jgi:pyridinium-3,5-biscarboxylic acid mononucleotide synthase